MDILVVGFLAKLLDIPAAAIGLVGGWFSRNWFHRVLTAFIGGSAGEVILYMREDTREFDPVIWLVGVAACFAWVLVAYLISSWLSRTK
jgi:hypothetical protein